jgi:hypothetical protein
MTAPKNRRMEKHEHLTDAQLDLYDRMSEISEDDCCAGWIHDNEYRIWDAIVNGNASSTAKSMNPRLLKRCQLLSVETSGWIYWADGPQFAPMAQWLAMVAARCKLAAAPDIH